MILFLRTVPLLVGLFTAFVFWSQRTHPTSYPWIVLLGIAAVPAASFVLAWKRVQPWDLAEKMAPTFLLVTALAFGLLLAEGPLALWAIILLAAVTSFVSLELLFLLAFHPSAYPVNGLSRVNVAYVPLIVWYAVSTSSGLITFLHSDRLWHVLLAVVLGVALFRTTGHPGATRRQNLVWMVVGGIVGLEVGWVGLLLPVSLSMQGVIAAIVFSSALRARRYLYDPKPSRRAAISEAVASCALLVASLVTAKWV